MCSVPPTVHPPPFAPRLLRRTLATGVWRPSLSSAWEPQRMKLPHLGRAQICPEDRLAGGPPCLGVGGVSATGPYLAGQTPTGRAGDK